MTLAQRRLLFWSPRLLGIAFAVLLSSFALDVFDEGYGFGRTILALGIHLIPTGIFLLALGSPVASKASELCCSQSWRYSCC